MAQDYETNFFYTDNIDNGNFKMVMLADLSSPLVTTNDGTYTWFLGQVNLEFQWMENHLKL